MIPILMGIVITVIALLLTTSVVAMSTAEAKKSSKYKAFVDIGVDTDCWTKATIKLTDGVDDEGHLLAKSTYTINPGNNKDIVIFFITKTLTFEGKKVHSNIPGVSGDRLSLTIHFNDEADETFGLYKQFSKSKHNYHFEDTFNLACRIVEDPD